VYIKFISNIHSTYLYFYYLLYKTTVSLHRVKQLRKHI